MRRTWEIQQVTMCELMGATVALAAFSVVPRYVLVSSGKPVPSEKMNVRTIEVV
ncbi:MAG: hypothetical protein NTX52_00165 [Planctomycetota bacterium]|nr:hypothetical protein [Planctomycetota bacterium]